MRIATFILAGLLAACATPGAPRAGGPGARVLDVPLYADRTDQCGPSALAGVMRYWGKDAPPAALKKEIYRSSLRGTLPVDLVLAAQARGMSAELLEGGLAEIKRQLDAGHPVIAFIDLGFDFMPVGHYVVVTGYDEPRRGFFINTDARKNAFISYDRFSRQWERTDRWAALILPS